MGRTRKKASAVLIHHYKFRADIDSALNGVLSRNERMKKMVLDRMPIVTPGISFLIDVYTMCGDSVQDAIAYCKLQEMSNQEIKYAIKAIREMDRLFKQSIKPKGKKK